MESKMRIEIVGVIKDPNFHVANGIAEGLKQRFPEEFLDPEIVPLLEFDWHTYLSKKKQELRGEVWQYTSNLMCFLNGVLLGNEKQLASWAENQWNFSLTHPEAFYTAITEEYYMKHLQKTGVLVVVVAFWYEMGKDRSGEDIQKRSQGVVKQSSDTTRPWVLDHTFVFMDIQIAGEAAGRLCFELFSDVCPKTSKNFEALCTGERGLSQSGLPLHYKGSQFHRIVPNGWVQGGGAARGNPVTSYFSNISPGSKGNGSESIYGPTFEDESFAVSHSKRGILGMANKGPHSNGSQYYITLQPAPWMDKTYVAFGQVVEGVDVLKKLEAAPTSNERPKYQCKVTACGVLPL